MALEPTIDADGVPSFERILSDQELQEKEAKRRRMVGKMWMLGRLRKRSWLERNQHLVSNIGIFFVIVASVFLLQHFSDPVPPAWKYFDKAHPPNAWPGGNTGGSVGLDTLIEFESAGAKAVCVTVGAAGSPGTSPPDPGCDSTGHKCVFPSLATDQHSVAYNSTVTYHRTNFWPMTSAISGTACVPEGKEIVTGSTNQKISTCESYKTNSYMILDPLDLKPTDAAAADKVVVISGSGSNLVTKVKVIGCHSEDNHSAVKEFTFKVANKDWAAPTKASNEITAVNPQVGSFDTNVLGLCMNCRSAASPSDDASTILDTDIADPICPDNKDGKLFPECGFRAEPGRAVVHGGSWTEGLTCNINATCKGRMGREKAQKCKVRACSAEFSAADPVLADGPNNIHSITAVLSFGSE